MEPIKLFLLLTAILPLVESEEAMKVSTLRGSLLFEQLAYRQITVNPQYFNFYRQFNMTHIENAIEVLLDYEKLYTRLCRDIVHMPEMAPEFVKVQANNTIFTEACRSVGGYLPELRSEQEADLLKQMMTVHGLRVIPAGVLVNKGKFVYMSDRNQVLDITRYRYCIKDCPTLSYQLNYDHFNSLTNNDFKMPTNEPHYVLSDGTLTIGPTPINKQFIICMKNRDIGLTALHFMLRSSCSRDSIEIKEQNKLLANEVAQFVSPQPKLLFNRLDNRNLNDNYHKRTRRTVIPLVSLFLLGGAVTRQSPLDALGSLGASMFGLGTKQDMIITKQKLQEHATQISNLAINQELIVKATNDIQSQIEVLSRFQHVASHKIAQAYAELDNKGLIRHLQNLIQLTFLKMQSAINSATQSIPSPYVFSNKDLQNITHTFRMNDIMLTTNINEISASVLVVDNQYTFMFNVPVHDDRNRFHFYEIRQLPVFADNKSYQINVANKYVGINDFTNEYILLSNTEFQRCLILPICILPSPFIKITDQSPCEILTFKDNAQRCPLTEVKNLPPIFYTYKNTTTYSIQSPMQIHVTCKQGRMTQSTYKTISGMGTFDVNPGCMIHVPPDTNIRPEYMIGQEYLSGDTLMGTIKEYTKDKAFLPLLLNVSTSTFKPLKIQEISTFEQGIDLIFNYENTATEVVRIIAYLAIAILILYSLTCCFPKLKLWLKSFCLITKPEKYWGMRKYIIPSPFIRKSKLNINPPSDPLETYMSSFRQRLAKIINKTSESETLPTKKTEIEDMDVDIESPPMLNNTQAMSYKFPNLPAYNQK
jgi:hypothetical protein